MISKFNLGQLNVYKLMFSMKFSMQKQIKDSWIAGFFLPAINATVFRHKLENLSNIHKATITPGSPKCIIFWWG